MYFDQHFLMTVPVFKRGGTYATARHPLLGVRSFLKISGRFDIAKDIYEACFRPYTKYIETVAPENRRGVVPSKTKVELNPHAEYPILSSGTLVYCRGRCAHRHDENIWWLKNNQLFKSGSSPYSTVVDETGPVDRTTISQNKAITGRARDAMEAGYLSSSI